MEISNKISNWSSSLKVLASLYIILILLGYGVSLLRVYEKDQFNLDEAVLDYRGSDEDDEMNVRLPQSYVHMLSTAHVHSFSQPVMLFLIGLIFLFTSQSEKTKILLFVSVFLGSLLSNATPWLVRYADAQFVYVHVISQMMLAVGVLIISFLSLFEMWKK